MRYRWIPEHGWLYLLSWNKNHGVKGKLRPDGKSIEKQQDKEVLGVDLSLSVSIKDRTVVGASDKIERMPLT